MEIILSGWLPTILNLTLHFSCYLCYKDTTIQTMQVFKSHVQDYWNTHGVGWSWKQILWIKNTGTGSKVYNQAI